MNSVKNRRIIVASLILPHTVVFGESNPSTPKSPPFVAVNPPPPHDNDGDLIKGLIKSRRSSVVGSPAFLAPGSEVSNPFAKATAATLTGVAKAIQESLPTPPNSTPLRKLPSLRRISRSPPHRRSSSSRASERLTWRIEPNSHCNVGLKNALDSVADQLRDVLWVGTLGTRTDSFGNDEVLKAIIDRAMKDRHSSVPVWLSDHDYTGCYDEFCHQVLWPCLHYAVPDAPKTKLFYESASFKQYVAVNQRFAEIIAANYQDGDIIWVNDYHLMLLPTLLRSTLQTRPSIGFFLHVAFPSSEIFRCLSVREDLLRGILGADLVGFQTANFARHFRQTVSRILALEALPKGIQLHGPKGEPGGGRFVDVGTFPMGIDVKTLSKRRQEREVEEWVQLLKQRYAGMNLVVGRDKLDTIQGVRHKLQAFEYFLDKYPEFQQRVVLIQVALQTTESNEHAGGVADVVAHINARFSTLTYQPVVFLHTGDLTFAQYLALLIVADAFLVTSLREGMALRTHEFVECQEQRHRPLILSEFTGSYSHSGFRSCIAINPWDKRDTAKAIHQALTMTDEEALKRWKDLHSQVIAQTAQAFVTKFLARCVRAHTEHEQIDLSLIPRFDVPCLLARYKHSHSRLLLVDLEGTLWMRDARRREDDPPEAVVELLQRLVRDERNQVWLLSGLPVKGVLEKMDNVPRLGIVAENGCFIKTVPTRNSPATWINMVVNFNLTWKSTCVEMLNYFTERTPGSFVEEREASVVWRFWTGADEDSRERQWARRQAAEAQNHIFDSLGERYGLRIIPGQNSFLILPNNVSRSTAVAAVLHPGGPSPSWAAGWMPGPDESDGLGSDIRFQFALAMSGDEKLLSRLKEVDHAETCSTSGKRTEARWKIEPGEVMAALWRIANLS